MTPYFIPTCLCLIVTPCVAWTHSVYEHRLRRDLHLDSDSFRNIPFCHNVVSYRKNSYSSLILHLKDKTSLKAGSGYNDINTTNGPLDSDGDELLWNEFNDGNKDQISTPSFTPEQLQSLLDGMSGNNNGSEDDSNNWMKTEQDFKIYADLLREMETTGEEGIYSNILGDLNSGANNREDIVIPPAVADADSPLVDDELTIIDEPLIAVSILEDIDGIGESSMTEPSESNEDPQDLVGTFVGTDEMMKRALQEALIEVRKNAPMDPASDPKSILNDKEMMKELNAIFDRANDQLLASISDIRKEQVRCT